VRIVELLLVDRCRLLVQLDALHRVLGRGDVAVEQRGQVVPAGGAAQHPAQAAVRVVGARLDVDDALVRRDRAIGGAVLVLELGRDLAQGRQPLGLGRDLGQALEGPQVVVRAAGLVVQIDQRLQRLAIRAVLLERGLVARDRALEVAQLLVAQGRQLAAHRGGAAALADVVEGLGPALEHLGQVGPLLVLAVLPLQGGQRVVEARGRAVAQRGGGLVGLDRLGRLRQLALEQIAELQVDVELGGVVGLVRQRGAQRVGQVGPLLRPAQVLGQRAVRVEVGGVELEGPAQRRQRVVGAVELEPVPHAQAGPPLRRQRRVGQLGGQLRGLAHQVGPRARRRGQALGLGHQRVVGRIQVDRAGQRLEGVLEIAGQLLVDLGRVLEQRRLRGRLLGQLEAAEQHLDDAVAVLGLARGALDAVDRVAGLGVVVGQPRQPAVEIVGVGAGLGQRHAGGGARVAQRLEPLDDALLGDVVAALAGQVHHLDVVLGHQLVDGDRAHAGAQEVVGVLRRLEHAEDAIEQRRQIGIAEAEADEHQRALDVRLARVVAQVDGARQRAAHRARRDDVGVEVAEHLHHRAAAARQPAQLLVGDDLRLGPALGPVVQQRRLEDVARERGPDVAERQLGDGLGHRRRLVRRLPGVLDQLVAGLFTQRAGEEPDRAHQVALVQELVEILGGGGVAVAPAALELLVHALEELLPGRYTDSRADDEGCAPCLDRFDERLGDRVLWHPKPRCL
jgi:hypothetical protein